MPRRVISSLAWAAKWFAADPWKAIGKAWSAFRTLGLRGGWERAAEKFSVRTRYRPGQYQLTQAQSETLLASCPETPLFSLVVPVYRIEPKWLDKCIRSVVAQHYRNWELLLVDDASERPDLTALMEEWAARDRRIRTRRLENNRHISAASNAGIEMAGGRYIGFLDHDDELTPDALTWVAWAIRENPGVRWIYSDEDLIDADGERRMPHFKPDYNPLTLLSIMYAGHFLVYEAETIRRLGGFRIGFEGSQDHDLALRVSEAVPAAAVTHIPRVLYHWRTLPGSSASRVDAKPYAAAAGLRAVREALARRGIRGEVSSHRLCPTLYRLELIPRSHPSVEIVIPTRNGLGLLTRCLETLRAHTRYPNYAVTVIDNQSDDPALLSYLDGESAAGRLRVLRYDRPFNHSDMNNLAVKASTAEFVVLANNDIEFQSDGWLEQMVATMQIDASIAAAGALLVFPNGNVQHGGVIVGLHGVAGHAFRNTPADQPTYFGRLHCLQEYSALTAALLMLRRSAFQEVGGFNADRYPTSFNDIDLCLRLRQQGYRLAYNPAVRAMHHEGKSRSISLPEEAEFGSRFRTDWGHLFGRDPFYNPNLSLQNERFAGFRDFPIDSQIAPPRRLACHPDCRVFFEGKIGLEIGGPSPMFRQDGLLPVYADAERIDNCNFGRHTLWEGDLRDGAPFLFDERRAPGTQRVAEATDVGRAAPGPYDFVLSSHTLEHVANPLRALSEWIGVLQAEGLLVLVLPHRDGTFDRKRPVTALAHLVQDFERNTGEGDMTHLEEILESHDLSRDPDAGDFESFRQRSLRNPENRCLHHHVFNTRLAIEVVDHMKLQLLAVEVFQPFDIFVVARKPTPGQPARNEKFRGVGTTPCWNSPFPSDRAPAPGGG